jgi:hypothetical protein
LLHFKAYIDKLKRNLRLASVSLDAFMVSIACLFSRTEL